MTPKISALLAGGIGAVIGGLFVQSATSTPTNASTEEPVRMGHLIVERLDVVEPDGTLRQVLYSKARDPQIIVRGKTFQHPSRTQSGMLFYNEEGTEVGGLIYDGSRKADGTASSGGSLTFDAYEQDQIVQLLGLKEGSQQISGLVVNDRPDAPMDFSALRALSSASAAEAKEIAVGANLEGKQRAFFGRHWNGDASIRLRDGFGRERLSLRVSKAGEAEIVFKNEDGAVVRTITSTDTK